MINKQRVKRAMAAFKAYPGREKADSSSSIADLVTDLLHLAHANDIDPDYIIRMAQMHYDAEVEKEAKLPE